MNLGDVAGKTVPKMTLVAPPREGGAITARIFIPHRAHSSIAVLGAVTVATACLEESSPANSVAVLPAGKRKILRIEHSTGELSCMLEIDKAGEIWSAALLRTARKLMDGDIFV